MDNNPKSPNHARLTTARRAGDKGISAAKRKAIATKASRAAHAKRKAQGWTPKPMHKMALRAVVEDPTLATDPERLACEIQCSSRSVRRWMAHPDFREWWTDQIEQAMRVYRGPAIARLVQITQDPDADPRVVVRAVDTLMKHIPTTSLGPATESFLEQLERWKGKRLRVGIEVGGEEKSAAPKPAQRNDGYRNLHQARARLVDASPEAMVTGPKSLEAAARLVFAELEMGEESDQGVGGSESQTGAGRAEGPRPYVGVEVGEVGEGGLEGGSGEEVEGQGDDGQGQGGMEEVAVHGGVFRPWESEEEVGEGGSDDGEGDDEGEVGGGGHADEGSHDASLTRLNRLLDRG